MKKKITAVIATIAITLTLTSCTDSENTHSSVKYIETNGITPNIVRYDKPSFNATSNSVAMWYTYMIDANTGVVYLEASNYSRYAITVMLNADGTPVTAEQLGLEY